MSNFQEKIEQLFPDETVTVRDYRSFINQPERIQITSQQDINDYDPQRLTTYFNFRVPLQRPSLNVKSIQLARASIPNAVPSFPDTDCVFWYYALPWVTLNLGEIRADNAGTPGDLEYYFDSSGNLYNPVTNALIADSEVYYDGSANLVQNDATMNGWIAIEGVPYTYNLAAARDSQIAAPPTPATYVPVYAADTNDIDYWIAYNGKKIADAKLNYLRYVRLLPSYSLFNILNYLGNVEFAYNRVFDDFDDLETEMDKATADDLIFFSDYNGDVGQFKFVKDLILFEYDSQKKKYSIFNNTLGNDGKTQFTLQPCTLDDPNWLTAARELQNRDRFVYEEFLPELSYIPQPFTPLRNLNYRLGFTYPTISRFKQDIDATYCPWPYALGLGGQLNSIETDAEALFAPGYPDLVNSACVHLYTDITGGATYDTIANRNYLGAIPMNTPTLGVGFHSLPLNNPLTKIPTQINEIYIEMRNDNGDPFYLPNNAIVSCEFILTYN